MHIDWVDGFSIRFTEQSGAALLSANREGLLSLAGILLALAGEEPGAHIHLDESNSLEDGSLELILEKTEEGRKSGLLEKPESTDSKGENP